MENSLQCELPPIVVCGAMDCETALLKSELVIKNEIQRGNGTFTEGFMFGYPVVVVKTLVGMVNAAVATAVAANVYNPRCIIWQGTSGAHNPELHQGDMILGSNIIENCGFFTVHRDEGGGLCQLEELIFQGKEVWKDRKVKTVRTFHSDRELMNIAVKVPYSAGCIKCGTISSGDIWSREIDRIRFYHNSLGSDCEEMEGFAAAMVCETFGIPLLVSRIISNSEYYPEETFSETLGTLCQQYTKDVIEAIVKQNAK